MKKPTVLVCKLGVAFWTDEERNKRSAKFSSAGDQGEASSIVRHLIERDDINTVYFGKWNGKIPEGLTVIKPNVQGIETFCTAREQRERWESDAQVVAKFDPKLFVTVSGYTPTRFDIGNKHEEAVQLCSMRYVGPALSIIERFKLKRLVVLCDTRNIPKEAEMYYGFPHIKPAAVLSLREHESKRVIMGVKTLIREVYGARYLIDVSKFSSRNKPYDCTIFQHAHIMTDKHLKGFDDVWRTVLAPDDDLRKMVASGLRLYGKGWEYYSKYDASFMRPPTTLDQMLRAYGNAKTTVLATNNRFYTYKIRFCLEQNCLPIFYGSGEEYTFDPLELYYPLDSPLRIKEPGDMKRLVEFWKNDATARKQEIKRLKKLTLPDWSLFDSCVSDVLNGADTTSDSWWKKYGGYRELCK